MSEQHLVHDWFDSGPRLLTSVADAATSACRPRRGFTGRRAPSRVLGWSTVSATRLFRSTMTTRALCVAISWGVAWTKPMTITRWPTCVSRAAAPFTPTWPLPRLAGDDVGREAVAVLAVGDDDRLVGQQAAGTQEEVGVDGDAAVVVHVRERHDRLVDLRFQKLGKHRRGRL